MPRRANARCGRLLARAALGLGAAVLILTVLHTELVRGVVLGPEARRFYARNHELVLGRLGAALSSGRAKAALVCALAALAAAQVALGRRGARRSVLGYL